MARPCVGTGWLLGRHAVEVSVAGVAADNARTIITEDTHAAGGARCVLEEVL